MGFPKSALIRQEFRHKKSNRTNVGDPEIEFLFTDVNVLSRWIRRISHAEPSFIQRDRTHFGPATRPTVPSITVLIFLAWVPAPRGLDAGPRHHRAQTQFA